MPKAFTNPLSSKKSKDATEPPQKSAQKEKLKSMSFKEGADSLAPKEGKAEGKGKGGILTRLKNAVTGKGSAKGDKKGPAENGVPEKAKGPSVGAHIASLWPVGTTDDPELDEVVQSILQDVWALEQRLDVQGEGVGPAGMGGTIGYGECKDWQPTSKSVDHIVGMFPNIDDDLLASLRAKFG